LLYNVEGEDSKVHRCLPQILGLCDLFPSHNENGDFRNRIGKLMFRNHLVCNILDRILEQGDLLLWHKVTFSYGTENQVCCGHALLTIN
jgi:hypothetical protein